MRCAFLEPTAEPSLRPRRPPRSWCSAPDRVNGRTSWTVRRAGRPRTRNSGRRVTQVSSHATLRILYRSSSRAPSRYASDTKQNTARVASTARFRPPVTGLLSGLSLRDGVPAGQVVGGALLRRARQRMGVWSVRCGPGLPRSRQGRQSGMCGGCGRVGGQIQPRERASWTASWRLAAPSLAAAEER
jgi:hypothetical protein